MDDQDDMQLVERLLGACAAIEASEAVEDWGKPHVILTYETDPDLHRPDGTQYVMVHGPYPDYATAIEARANVEANFNVGGQDPPFRSHIARMWGPDE